MDIAKIITNSLSASQRALKETLSAPEFVSSIEHASKKIIDTYKSKGKVLLAGNGGSAADCQHICAEFVGRLNFDREPLSAIALTTNSSNLTCIANDYGFEEIFVRQMYALAQENDSLLVYSTSGTSSNIINLIREARGKVRNIISLCGQYTNDLAEYSDVVISVKSDKTTRIQEIHAIVGHIICECVEENLFGNKPSKF